MSHIRHFPMPMPMPMPGVGPGSAPTPERTPVHGPGIPPHAPPPLPPRRSMAAPPPRQMPPGFGEQPASRGIGTTMALAALTGGVSLKQMALGAAAHALGSKMSGAMTMATIGHSMMSGHFQPSHMMAHSFGHALDMAAPVLSPFSMSNMAYGAMVGYNPFDAMTGAMMSLPFHLASR